MNIKWTLHPPHGVSFKNEMGSEVSIEFPEEMAGELFHWLTAQLQNLFTATIKRPEMEDEYTDNTVDPPEQRTGSRRITKFKIDAEGNLIGY